MKHALQLAVFVSLAIAMGCGSAGSSGPSNVGPGVDNDASGSTDTAPQSGTVVAMAPDGLTGDFYFADTLTCTGTSSCEASVDGSVTVEFKCPKHLFLPKSAVGDPTKDQQIAWTDPGDWGLAPNGVYYDEQAQGETLVKTWIEDHRILLDDGGSTIGEVNGDKFSWTKEGEAKSIGTISVDLKKIVYHMTKPSGQEFDIVLTLVE